MATAGMIVVEKAVQGNPSPVHFEEQQAAAKSPPQPAARSRLPNDVAAAGGCRHGANTTQKDQSSGASSDRQDPARASQRLGDDQLLDLKRGTS